MSVKWAELEDLQPSWGGRRPSTRVRLPRRSSLFAGLLVTAAAIAPGCAKTDRKSPLTVSVDAEAALALTTVRIIVSAPGRKTLSQDFPPVPSPHWELFVQNLTTTSKLTITVVAAGVDNAGRTLVTQSGLTTMGYGDTVAVSLRLAASCRPDPNCPDGKTCDKGACVPQTTFGTATVGGAPGNVPDAAIATDSKVAPDVGAGTTGSEAGHGGADGGSDAATGVGVDSGDATSGPTNGTGGSGGASPVGCAAGARRLCMDDPDTSFLGNCGSGIETCSDGKWGTCSVQPATKDSCALVGDDASCNGKPNEGCPCVDGDTQPCGPAADMGTCRRGTQTCAGGSWGACVGAVYASARDCTSTVDNNCDGVADNTIDAVCTCASAGSRPCDQHQGADGTGRCNAGSQSCVVAADKKTSTWGACSGSVGPAAKDTCETGNDDNCNGVPNEGCSCVTGATQACGPAANVGICKRGTQTCTAGAWGTCVGAVMPGARDCTSTADNDCDGKPDNTSDAVCACKSGATQACGQHPGQDGRGPCKAGSQTCVIAADKKTSAWGACNGAVGPAPADTCDPMNDNNCNGVPTEGCTCVNGTTRGCGPAAIGICRAGTQTCANSAWGTCVGAVNAQARDCTSTKDNDCNGTADNADSSCACSANTTQTCTGSSTPPCSPGTRTCMLSADKGSTSWGTTCVGAVAPKLRDCTSAIDNDCNGTPDNLDSTCMCAAGTHKCSGVCQADTSTTFCGAGCVKCPTPPANATAICSGGTCGVSCINTYKSCGAAGTCVPMGGCCSSSECTTTTKNMVGICGTNSMCSFACANGFKPCGSSCISTAAPSCCTTADCTAGPTGSTPTCASNTCSYGCPSLTHNCSGACVSNNSVSSCGTTSCVACPAPAGGVATCNGTTCGISCNNTSHQCGTSCTSNSDAQHCGPDCNLDCTQANAVAACGTGSSCNNKCTGTTLSCPGPNGRPNCGSWNFDDSDLEGWGFTNALGGFVSTADKRYGENFTNATAGYLETFVQGFLCQSGQTVDLTGKSLHFDISANSTLAGIVHVTPVFLNANYDVVYTFSTQGLISDFPGGLTTEKAGSAPNVATIGLQISFSQAVASGVVFFDNISIQ